MTLTTERLILRPFTMDDVEAAHRWGGNPANVRYMFWGPNTLEGTRWFIDFVIKRAENEPRRDYDFAVVLRETGAVIGSCGINVDGSGAMAELGWILHLDHHKNGYGTELAAELIRFGFEDLRLHRIFAPCAAVNYGSYRIMERNGMRREATHVRRFGRALTRNGLTVRCTQFWRRNGSRDTHRERSRPFRKTETSRTCAHCASVHKIMMHI